MGLSWLTSQGRFFLLLSSFLVTSSGSAQSLNDASTTETDRWRLQITPYAWLPSVQSQLKPLASVPHTAQVKQSFHNVFKNLRLAAFVNASLRYNRFVLLTDYSYASLTQSGAMDLPLGLATVPVKAKLRQSIFSFSAGYTFYPHEHHTLDVLAGLRTWRIKADIQTGLPAALPIPNQYGSSTRITDPIIGARLFSNWSERWSTVLHADLGVAGQSHRTWQVQAAVNYRLTPNWYGSVGYRYLKLDYQRHNKRLDLNMRGPILGLSYVF